MTSEAELPRGSDSDRLPEYPSYLGLLGHERPITAAPKDDIDGVIVPAGRPATSILHAANLAEEVGAVIVVLCSNSASADEVAGLLARRDGLTWYAVDIPRGYAHPLLELTARSVVPQQLVTTSDLSRKRNIGLILGRGLGDRLLFMDDDITLRAAGVREAARLLTRYSMVGFRPHPDGFPDNSVDVHALRALRQASSAGTDEQEPIGQHISGNSLAVRTSAVVAHFPEGVYDEDWLFMYEATAQRRVTQAATTSWQSKYDPFASPERAAREEFGNIMSKGLYEALKTPGGSSGGAELGDERYWTRVIEDRRNRLDSLHGAARAWSLGAAHPTDPIDDEARRQAPRVERSLGSALEANALVSPDLCVAFYQAWHDVDRPTWNERYSALPALRGIEPMLDLLGLSPSTITYSTA